MKIQGSISTEPCNIAYYLTHRWLNQNRRVFLDLGCGNGRNSIPFMNAGFKVFALDLSAKRLSMARQLCVDAGSNITFSLGSMMNMPYDDEMFDCILAYHVIYHADTDGVKKAVAELYRIMNAGAEAYVTFLSKESYHWTHAQTFLDSHTFLKQHSMDEVNVPHYGADYADVYELLKFFDVKDIYSVKRILRVENNEYEDSHIHVLIKK